MTPTKNYYTSNNANYTTFGGRVYNYDYDNYMSMSDIASRIILDWKFDEKCRKLAINKTTKKGL